MCNANETKIMQGFAMAQQQSKATENSVVQTETPVENKTAYAAVNENLPTVVSNTKQDTVSVGTTDQKRKKVLGLSSALGLNV